MSNVVHRSIRKASLPRTGRELDAMPGGVVTSSGGVVSPGGSTPGTATDHSQLTGVISTADKYSDSAKDIHLTAQAAKDLDRLSNLEIIKSTDKDAIPTDFNLYSALKSKLEDEKQVLEMEKKFIRKDKPDETDYRVDFHDGITMGHYVGGLLGDGAIIDEEGNSEMTSLKLREFLEVPELRFNRIDVVSGELWNSIAFGLIESVDEVGQIVTLKLEDGELSGLHVNDFCRGIFHNLTGNETEGSTDSAGFQTLVGFSTAYFTPVEIIDNAHFRYELKPGSTVHPCASMKFAVYGNASDKSRQASAYSTRTYKRYLINVDTWAIDPSRNISYQEGDLSNLIINGESLAGGSVYLNNVYFGSNILSVGGLENPLKGKDAYSVTLTTYSAVYNVADGIYEQLDVVTGGKNVVTGSDLVVASDFTVSTRIQASKGPDPLRYSDTIGEGKYVVTSEGVNCSYVISDGMVAVKEVTADKAQIFIHVNCEGMSIYDLEFTIVRVKNGEDGKDYEYIYTRTANYVAPSTPGTSQTDDYIPSGWTDDPTGPTLQLPYEWVSKRTKRGGLWGNYSTPSLWSRFGEDGTDYEYIYTRTTTDSRPSTPTTSQNNDYVPSGWTDDPIGPTSSLPYEWVSQRAKVNSVWGEFTTPALWSRYAEDGKDHEYIYRRTSSYSAPSTPTTSQSDDYVPSGWTDDPVGPTSSLPYEWVCERTKVKGVWGNFSTPSLWAKYSFDGQDGRPGTPGQDGRYNEDRYRRSSSQPSTPSGTSPSGWSLDPPAGDTPLWLSTAIFNGNGSLYRSWSVPRKITGDTGAQGNSGPAITYRGVYSSSTLYVGNATRVDVVKYGDRWYMAKTTAGAFSGQAPSVSYAYWELLQGQFESIATGLLIADQANIAGWRFKENYIESQNSNVVLNGNADNTPKIALGASYANRNNAPARLYEDGRVYFKTGTFAGDLEGVSGSFKRLNCVNDNGDVVGGISFDSGGRMWFSGDMFHQGGYTFYTGDIRCRSGFGARFLNALMTSYSGNTGYYCLNGPNNAGNPDGNANYQKITFTARTDTGNNRYYEVPLYGSDGKAAGFPVNLFIIQHGQASVFRYDLRGVSGQFVIVANSNDANNNIQIATNGRWIQLSGGVAALFVNAGYHYMIPSVPSSRIGAGWMCVGMYDNDW